MAAEAAIQTITQTTTQDIQAMSVTNHITAAASNTQLITTETQWSTLIGGLQVRFQHTAEALMQINDTQTEIITAYLAATVHTTAEDRAITKAHPTQALGE